MCLSLAQLSPSLLTLYVFRHFWEFDRKGTIIQNVQHLLNTLFLGKGTSPQFAALTVVVQPAASYGGTPTPFFAIEMIFNRLHVKLTVLFGNIIENYCFLPSNCFVCSSVDCTAQHHEIWRLLVLLLQQDSVSTVSSVVTQG